MLLNHLKSAAYCTFNFQPEFDTSPGLFLQTYGLTNTS